MVEFEIGVCLVGALSLDTSTPIKKIVAHTTS
jgi:hypothetical protein